MARKSAYARLRDWGGALPIPAKPDQCPRLPKAPGCSRRLQVCTYAWQMQLMSGGTLSGLGLALARLCRVTGGRPEVAWWLALAGPFSLLMLIAALHNECVMLALLVGGVAVAASVRSLWRALVLGAALVGRFTLCCEPNVRSRTY